MALNLTSLGLVEDAYYFAPLKTIFLTIESKNLRLANGNRLFYIAENFNRVFFSVTGHVLLDARSALNSKSITFGTDLPKDKIPELKGKEIFSFEDQ